jgi:anti-sigma regulatory factor (Ser/Thr protein kinase)
LNLSIELAPTPNAGRELRKFLDNAAGVIGLVERQRHILATALTEHCNNIVRYATPAATFIRVELTHREGEWEIELVDDSGEFDPTRSPRFNPLITANSALNTSGMGIALIATCFPDCRYTGKSQANDHLNHFHLRLHSAARSKN